jgi:hypothetical protein
LLSHVLPCCSASCRRRAQTVPKERNEVASSGGQIKGGTKVSLVKVADGFNDPVNVASAFDGTGRLCFVERVGKVKIVTKDGKVLDPPFMI